ncbi:hypothetical protein FHX74_000933 [Friedmanniella endophytica]|uniref:CoA carboxyltransferase C-terminal domain-containing protein n=1 Tax=Microlunatus kandeliicorticis TaxID=1759536 RepID=A0A7W3IQF0_9ACTN|nr:acyl-CoA carboxylase epsilon subunit [Microlunatus kandeliicorticis]MBA8793339.1 hypothetical protein [Microlunatus kandeliicorticis]
MAATPAGGPAGLLDAGAGPSGFGTVDGRPVALVALEGSSSARDQERAAALVDRAGAERTPVVGWFGDLDPGEDPGPGPTLLLGAWARAGAVLRIVVVTGSVGGPAAFAAAAADLVIMVDGSRLWASPPATVALATGDALDADALAGARTHATLTGLAHRVPDQDAAVALVRELIAVTTNADAPPPPDPDPDEPLPPAGTDGRATLAALLDDATLVELRPDHAAAVITGFGRIDGRAVGAIASDPAHRGGALDLDALGTTTRFLRLCDRLGLPVISSVDSVGLVPEAREEWGGIVRAAAELATAHATATVPRVTVITATAEGPAAALLGGVGLGARVLDRSDDPTTAETRAMIIDALAAGPGPGSDRTGVLAPPGGPPAPAPATPPPATPAPAAQAAATQVAAAGPVAVRGHPDDAELAALITVLAATRSGEPVDDSAGDTRDHPPGHDPGHTAGPDGWSRHWRRAVTGARPSTTDEG